MKDERSNGLAKKDFSFSQSNDILTLYAFYEQSEVETSGEIFSQQNVDMEDLQNISG